MQEAPLKKLSSAAATVGANNVLFSRISDLNMHNSVFLAKGCHFPLTAGVEVDYKRK